MRNKIICFVSDALSNPLMFHVRIEGASQSDRLVLEKATHDFPPIVITTMPKCLRDQTWLCASFTSSKRNLLLSNTGLIPVAKNPLLISSKCWQLPISAPLTIQTCSSGFNVGLLGPFSCPAKSPMTSTNPSLAPHCLIMLAVLTNLMKETYTAHLPHRPTVPFGKCL